VIGEPQPLAMAHLRDLTRLDIRCARCKGHGAALDNAVGLTLARRRAGRIATGQRQDRGGRSAITTGEMSGMASAFPSLQLSTPITASRSCDG